MEKPDNTAQRTALWRALHLEIDDAPLILRDHWALKLVRPAAGWKQRPDMKYTKPLRASIVGRARFVESKVRTAIESGITQYIILGAGLDSFALRYHEQHPKKYSQLQVFEIDQPATLHWKAACIKEQIKQVPENLHLIGVDFEKTYWWDALTSQQAGFDPAKPAVISCTGVTLYLSLTAIKDMLARICGFAPGSKAIISFYAPLDSLEGEDKKLLEISIKGAAAAATPMISFFQPAQVIELCEAAGFKNCRIYDSQDLTAMYFADRKDDLVPNKGELFLVADI